MKQTMAVISAVLALTSLIACGSSTPAGSGGSSGTAGHGGVSGSGGMAGSGSVNGSGGSGGGGTSGGGGVTGAGGQPSGGTAGHGGGGQTGVCPYTVASFSCAAACAKLHDFYARCQNDATVPAELQAMLGLYGQVTVISTSTCAVVAPAAQAQWACFQGVPDGAACSAIAGCDASNCP
jgi:hypothetical protein